MGDEPMMTERAIRVGELVMPRKPDRNSMFYALWGKKPGVVTNTDERVNGLVIVQWPSRTGGIFKGGEAMHNLEVVGDALEDSWGSELP
jgi:hypothetical protein